MNIQNLFFVQGMELLFSLMNAMPLDLLERLEEELKNFLALKAKWISSIQLLERLLEEQLEVIPQLPNKSLICSGKDQDHTCSPIHYHQLWLLQQVR